MSQLSLENWGELQPDNNILGRRIEITNSKYWLTPPKFYKKLDEEFHFDFDPCPYPYQKDGVRCEWGLRNWVNPPFRKKDSVNNHGPTAFVRKAIQESKKGKTSVLILPVQSYVNMLIEAKAEMRPVGRLKWIDAITGKPFPSPTTVSLFILRPEVSP